MGKNFPIRIYVNQIENKITFRIKIWWYLQLLKPEMIKLTGSTKSKMTKDENGERVPRLELREVVLFHWNIINNNYQQNSGVLYRDS